MWYKSWFNTPYYYMLYRERDSGEAAAFVSQLCRYFNPDKEAWILDLACGKGRHSIHMNRLGYKVHGVDISEQNIQYAKAFENEHLKFSLHDMRKPFRKNGFGLVLNLFTSFGYFENMEENKLVLEATHHNLTSKGRLLIDFLNVHWVKQHLVKKESLKIEEVLFKISRCIENEVIIKKIEVIDGDKRFHFEEQVKAFTKQQFCGLLAQTGFELLEIFGNYTLDQFNPEHSPRLIIAARKTT